MSHQDSASPPLSAPASLGCGLLMGGADAIPGVSGGTVALILGIYETFIAALAMVVGLPIAIRSAEGRAALGGAFRFLIPLGIGVAVAYYLATKLLVGGGQELGLIQAPESAPLCYGFFFGLVLLSLREPWRRIAVRSPASYALAAGAAIAAAVFSGLPYATREPETWMLLYGGAFAICVMLLPGVSGSLLLVILGQYQAVVTAVHDRDLVRVGVFLAGIVLGVAAFVPLLRRLLRRHHDLTMAALTGLMVGSLRALWPWKTHYVSKPQRDGGVARAMENIGIQDDWPWVLVALLGGAMLILILSRFERKAGGTAPAS